MMRGSGEAAHVGEERGRRLVGVLLGGDLGLHDVAQLVGASVPSTASSIPLRMKGSSTVLAILQGEEAFPRARSGEGDERGDRSVGGSCFLHISAVLRGREGPGGVLEGAAGHAATPNVPRKTSSRAGGRRMEAGFPPS